MKDGRVDIIVNYKSSEINLNLQLDKAKQILNEMLMPELLLITSLRSKEKQRAIDKGIYQI